MAHYEVRRRLANGWVRVEEFPELDRALRRAAKLGEFLSIVKVVAANRREVLVASFGLAVVHYVTCVPCAPEDDAPTYWCECGFRVLAKRDMEEHLKLAGWSTYAAD